MNRTDCLWDKKKRWGEGGGEAKGRNQVGEQGQTGSEHREAENTQVAVDLGSRLVPGVSRLQRACGGTVRPRPGARTPMGPALLLSAVRSWAASLNL